MKVGGQVYAVNKREARQFLQQSSQYKEAKLNTRQELKAALTSFRQQQAVKKLFSQLEVDTKTMTLTRSEFKDALKAIFNVDERIRSRMVAHCIPFRQSMTSGSNDSLTIDKQRFFSVIHEGDFLEKYAIDKTWPKPVRIMDAKGGFQGLRYDTVRENDYGRRFIEWLNTYKPKNYLQEKLESVVNENVLNIDQSLSHMKDIDQVD